MAKFTYALVAFIGQLIVEFTYLFVYLLEVWVLTKFFHIAEMKAFLIVLLMQIAFISKKLNTEK